MTVSPVLWRLVSRPFDYAINSIVDRSVTCPPFSYLQNKMGRAARLALILPAPLQRRERDPYIKLKLYWN